MMEIVLTAGSDSVSITGTRSALTGKGVAALAGWYSTPDAKVETTERQAGMGAHNVTDDMVLYSTRTVTVDVAALAATRAEVLSIMERVQRFAGRVLTIRVADGGRDTYATGYLACEWGAERWENAATAAITVVCPDPRRYSTKARTAWLGPLSGTQGGLMFDDAGVMLTSPVSFFGDTEGGNACTLANGGTATAYPTITVSGRWPDGVVLNLGDGGQLAYGDALLYQNLTLDCLTRTATVNGVDVTRALTSRDFPSVPPGGDVRLGCVSAGEGSIEVSVRDTYI